MLYLIPVTPRFYRFNKWKDSIPFSVHQNGTPPVYYPFSDLFRHILNVKTSSSPAILTFTVSSFLPWTFSRKMFQKLPCFYLQVSCGVLEVLPTRQKGPGTRMGRAQASGMFSHTGKGKWSGMRREILPVMVTTKSRYCSRGIHYNSANVLGPFLDPAFPFWRISFSCSKGLFNLRIQGLIFLISTVKSPFLVISLNQ